MSAVVPMIVRVYGDEGGGSTDVPVTPETTGYDLIECCRDPGDFDVELVGIWSENSELIVRKNDRPLEILQKWDVGKDPIKLTLRYTPLQGQTGNGVRSSQRNGMKEPGVQFDETLPDGVQLTLSELRDMAYRQQHQIESQHQLLAAKEQKLRFLKEQEARHARVASENERLRRLRDRVEVQELKLQKLRALRGQVDQNKQNNAILTNDLDSIRALFNEKEKELSVAVAKVDELTRQLEDLKRGRASNVTSAAALELEKLRRELMYRNKLNEQQNQKIFQQHETYVHKQDEANSIDQRIVELQNRLHRKRLLNQQLANQLSAASMNKNNQLPNHLFIQNAYHILKPGAHVHKQLQRSNVATIEPYKHTPLAVVNSHNNNNNNNANSQIDDLQKHYGGNQILSKDELDACLDPNIYNTKLLQQNQQILQANHVRMESNDGVSEFTATKTDPKYQTLPYNTKFSLPNKKYEEQEGDRQQERSQDRHQPSQLVQNQGQSMHKPMENQRQEMYQGYAQGQRNDMDQSNNNINEHYRNATTNYNGYNVNDGLRMNSQGYYGKQTSNLNNLNTTYIISNGVVTSNSYGTHVDNVGSTNTSANGSSNGINTNNISNNGSNYPTNSNGNNIKQGYQHMTVHSTPLSVINKGLAVPVSQRDNRDVTMNNVNSNPVRDGNRDSNRDVNPNRDPSSVNNAGINSRDSVSVSTTAPVAKVDARTKDQIRTTTSNVVRGQPVGGPSTPHVTQTVTSTSGSATAANQSSVTSQNQAIPSTNSATISRTPTIAFHSSSVKIQTVEPQISQQTSRLPVPTQQTFSHNYVPHNTHSHFHTPQTQPQDQSILLSPPNSASTPLSTPDNTLTGDKSPKPVLPPKPAIKPPPRLTQPDKKSKDAENKVPMHTIINHADTKPIKAKPLTIIRKCNVNVGDHPRLKSQVAKSQNQSQGVGNVHVSINRRIEMPPAFLFPELETIPSDFNDKGKDPKPKGPVVEEENNNNNMKNNKNIETTKITEAINNRFIEDEESKQKLRQPKTNLTKTPAVGHTKVAVSRRVSFDPLALLLDASLEGELELVKKTVSQVTNPSAANDEGITALHNAICAGHIEIVKFLVEYGCDVNAQDSDGWTPLHCAASCNNVGMVKFLVENGACIFATTLSDHETAAEKCEEDEEGFDGCSEYLYSVQEKLGIMNNGSVYAVFDYTCQQADELSFNAGDQLTVIRKGDDNERDWWWSRLADTEGYVPKNLLGLYPRVPLKSSSLSS